MTVAIEHKATAGKHAREAEPSFCRTCPARAGCEAICDELEGCLHETCHTQVSVPAITFASLGIEPEDLPAGQDRRLRVHIA